MTSDPIIPISKAFDAPAEDSNIEVEGHAYKMKAVEQPANADTPDEEDTADTDVEGHKWRLGATPDVSADAEDETAEVEGHGSRRWAVPEQPADVDDEMVEDDVEGHAMRIKAMEQPADDPEAETEVEGHGMRIKAVEQPAGDDEAEPGDAESLIKYR